MSHQTAAIALRLYTKYAGAADGRWIHADGQEARRRRPFPCQCPGELSEATPLHGKGTHCQIATLQLVMYMEETFRGGFEPHEVDKESLDTLALMAQLLDRKMDA